MENHCSPVASPAALALKSAPVEGGRARPTAVATRTRLRVRHQRSNGSVWGRAFRDPGEQVIEHQVVPHRPYHSFLSAPPLLIDVDAEGSPILVELDYSGADVVVDPILRPPIDFGVGTLRFLDIPSRCRPGRISTDAGNSLFHIEFSANRVVASVQHAPGAIWEIDQQSCLCGLWLLRGLDDPYGRRRARWRGRCWRQARLRALLAGSNGTSGRLSPISDGDPAEPSEK